MRTVKELLIAARKRIDTPEKLLQDGRYTDGERYCSLGVLSLSLAAVEYSYEVYEAARDVLDEVCGIEHIANFNDHSTHAEVMAMWDQAIASV